jgi:hypothetical protein
MVAAAADAALLDAPAHMRIVQVGSQACAATHRNLRLLAVSLSSRNAGPH